MMICFYSKEILVGEIIPVVNFINILRTKFLYERCFVRFSLVTCT